MRILRSSLLVAAPFVLLACAQPVVETPLSLPAVPDLPGEVLGAAPDGTPVYAAEPQEGQLAEGQRILVDDGACGSGQIKQVVGGAPGTGVATAARQSTCIDRPQGV
ncbi:MAG: DUF6719 family protein [Pseudomonadota bacterium]